jgi:hypothetical protein
MKALNEQNTAIYYMANKLMILLDFIKVMPVFNQYCIKLLGAMLKELSPVKSKSPLEISSYLFACICAHSIRSIS